MSKKSFILVFLDLFKTFVVKSLKSFTDSSHWSLLLNILSCIVQILLVALIIYLCVQMYVLK